MKLKGLSAAIALGCAVASGSASAIVVGGVDFGTLGEDPTRSHLETATLAETFINGDNQLLMGYGVVEKVNGDSSYASGNNLLYFTFEYTSQNFTGSTVEFTDGTVNVYYGDLGPGFNFFDQSSPANLGLIQGLTEWVQFEGHANLADPAATPTAEIFADGTLTGASVSFTGQGLLDVVNDGSFGLASVANFLDSDGVLDGIGGLADVIIGTEGNNFVLNPNDIANGECAPGNQQVGEWCIQGTASLRGRTEVPAPAGIALIGAGLLGFGAMTRRKKA